MDTQSLNCEFYFYAAHARSTNIAAPASFSAPPRGDSLAWFWEVVYDVDPVSIDLTNIEDRHASSALSTAQPAAMLVAGENVNSRSVCSLVNRQSILFRQCPWIIGKKTSLGHCVPCQRWQHILRNVHRTQT